MRARIGGAVLVLAFCASCGGEDVFSKSYGVRGNTGLSQFIVTFDGPVNQAAVGNAGGQMLRPLSLVNGWVVLLPDQAAANILRTQRNVRSVEEDALVYAIGKTPPPQPPQTTSWGISKVGADVVWSTSTGAGVDVAVIDTGIDPSHPDLAANLKGGVNFVWNKGKVDPTKWTDDNGHGTHVAGTVAAANNTIGVVGVAPGANLWAVKVLNRNGSGYTSDVISGIEWAMNNGIKVANMSLGASSGTLAMEMAVNNAYAAGVLLIAAAGNSGDCDLATNNVGYPAGYDSVVAVATTASDNLHPCWSSDGPKVELAAPGVGVLSTYKGSAYATLSGTSMATPHTSGAAAVLLATPVQVAYDANLNGLWEPDEARAALAAAATDLGEAGRDNYFGWGLVNLPKALGLVP
jgi:subtilisin family serine protease